MSRHPVTPMAEADLTLHLGKQTALLVALADLVTISAADADQRVDKTMAELDGILLIDVDSAPVSGFGGRQILAGEARRRPVYSRFLGRRIRLLQAWKAEGLLGEPTTFAEPGKVDRPAVVSGSVSPTTERADPQRDGKRLRRHRCRSAGSRRRKR